MRDVVKARKFGNVFRFIDDLNAMCDNGEFEKCHKDIYPEELELKKENEGNKEASFLDMYIKVEHEKFSVRLFDKRDAFPFSIVRMPFISSNIPTKIFYSSLSAEVLRIGRATSHIDDFITSSKQLLARMIKQGAKIPKIETTLRKMFGRHSLTLQHLAKTPVEFLNNLS